jgi:hypothetical protein
MPDSTPAALPAVINPWDEDVIYATLANPVRRRILLSLARNGPQTGAQLMGGVKRQLSATLKHLVEMRSAGLVMTHENPGDGRRLLYLLSPGVPLTKTEKGAVVDFGFCLLRL